MSIKLAVHPKMQAFEKGCTVRNHTKSDFLTVAILFRMLIWQLKVYNI